MEVQRRLPREVGQAELAAHRMDVVMHLAVGRIAARVVADLPTVVAGRANFEQQFLIPGEWHVLADAPVQREALAGGQVEVVLVGIDFVGQRGGDGGGLVGPGIPRHRPLQLVRPEAVPDVVRGFYREGAAPGEGYGLRVVVTGGGVKTVGKGEVPMREGHAQPDRLYIQVAHVKARVLDGAPAPGGCGQRRFQAGIGKVGRDDGAVFQGQAEWLQVGHPEEHRYERIQVHIHVHPHRDLRPAVGIDGDGVDFVTMAVVESTSMVEVIIEAAVEARLRHEVVADVQDAAVEVANLGGLRGAGRGTERDGQQEDTAETGHGVFLLWVAWWHRVGAHGALRHLGASQVVVKRRPRASAARYSRSSRLWASIALREIALLAGQRRWPVRCTLDCRERLYQEQGLGAFLGQFLDPLLQLRDLLRVLVGKVGVLRRVLRDIVQLQHRRQRGAPDELPVPLADAAAERLDI